MEQKVAEISDSIKLEPYTIDSVTLVSGNAVFNRLQKHGYWELRQ